MQSFLDTSVILSIVVIFYVIVYQLLHKLFLRVGYERGLLSEKLVIVLLFFPAILFFIVYPSSIPLVRTGTIVDIPQVLMIAVMSIGVGSAVVVGMGCPMTKRKDDDSENITQTEHLNES